MYRLLPRRAVLTPSGTATLEDTTTSPPLRKAARAILFDADDRVLLLRYVENGDPEMKAYKDALHKYAPDADPANQFNAYGWAVASSLHRALDAMKCRTREGLRDAVRSLKDVKVNMLLPGVTMSTGHGDAFPLETMRLMRFKGERWQLFGRPVDTRKEFGPAAK